MKLSILAQGSRGDIQPYVALALALRARGHSVRLAGNENFAAFAAACGVEFVPLPGDSREMVEDPVAKARLAAGDVRGFFMRVFELSKPNFPALRKALDQASEGADLLLGTAVMDHVSVPLARRHGAKLVLSYLAPAVPSRSYAPAMLFTSAPDWGPLNAPLHALAQWGWWRVNLTGIRDARADWGEVVSLKNQLTPARRGAIPTLLGYSSLLFEASLQDQGANCAVSGHWPLPSPVAQGLAGDHHDEGFQHWLEDGSPPLFFGLGSMPVLQPEAMIELVGELAERLGLRAVIGAGWTEIDMAACDLPDDVAVVGACDYEWLFSHCAAILHHGGSGTTHTAASSGLPQVVCPVFADQPFWAGRVKRLGLGAVLPFQKLGIAALERAFLDALEPGVQERAAAFGAGLRAERGLEQACLVLERYAAP